jgi:hypothetical protein
MKAAVVDDLQARVRDLLLTNVSEGYSKLLGEPYCYIQPSRDTYPYQFWWDTCFHVFMLCRLGEHRLAQDNLRSLFTMQEDNGFVGHMIFWKQSLPSHMADVLQARPSLRAIRPHMSALIQPPLTAQALERQHRCTGDAAFLAEFLPKLIRHFEWLARERDRDGTGLLTTISPFESGLDFKPSYDPLLGYPHGPASKHLLWKAVGVDFGNFRRRYDLKKIFQARRFLVKDVLVNVLYACDLLALARLCALSGFAELRETYAARAKRTQAAILEMMYDSGRKAFFDLGPDDRQIPVRTFTLFAPLMLPDLPKDIAEDLVTRHFQDRAGFALPYPIPSVAADDAAFEPGENGRYLWRGPTWAAANWCLWQGLDRQGYRHEAARLTDSLRKLVELSGFREYYDPLTGVGYGAKGFTWSGLVVDMLEESAVVSVRTPAPAGLRKRDGSHGARLPGPV